MKKYILSAILFATIFSSGCISHDNTTEKNPASVGGNSDSVGSQPIQPVPDTAITNRATDTLNRKNSPTSKRDSIVKD